MGPGRADMDVDDPSSLMRSTRRDVGTDTVRCVLPWSLSVGAGEGAV